MQQTENQNRELMLGSVPLCPSLNQATKICLNPKCGSKQKLFNQKQKINSKQEQKISSTFSAQKKQYKNPFICTNKDCQSCGSNNLKIITSNTSSNSSLNTSKQTIKINSQNQLKSEQKNYCYKKQNRQIKHPNHQKCLVADYDSLIFSLQQKIKESEPLKNYLNQVFDNFIDYLSQMRDQLIQQFCYYGLTIDQKLLLKLDKNNKFNQINSIFIQKIVKQLDEQIKLLQAIHLKKEVQKLWKQQEIKIKQIMKQFTNNIMQYSKKQFFKIVQIQSNVLSQSEQKNRLVNMLEDNMVDKKVSSFKLLYRASQNQFDTKKFHQKCDLIKDTVILIQTQYGKKIGGYNPREWDKRNSGNKYNDPSLKTFIFSITNNHKFKLKSPEQTSIIQYQTSGPTFGKSDSDIYLSNKANIDRIHGNIGNSYIHPDYRFSQQQSWTKFSGATNGMKFKVKQWEAFQIIWRQSLAAQK